VFVDFGRGKVYALTDKGEQVEVFDNLEDVIGKLCPDAVVIDSLPAKFQKTAAELTNTGITFLRLKNLKKISEERKSNGVKKTNENDVKLLRGLFYRHPEEFQPLSTSPEELEVRALTELWVELARLKMSAKRARTTTINLFAVEAHKTVKRFIEKLSEEIHREALKLPLYREAVEELGLKGPSLAYIVSHDGFLLRTLPRDRLATRYAMYDCQRRRRLRGRLLIMLANTAVIHRHPRYMKIYEYYRQKGKKHWQAVLRVAKIMSRDLQKIARKAGPPA